jgi:ADP-ribosyl-[dinitrogen reductase] hydrolase
MDKNNLFGGLFDLVIGDALGLPVQFQSRENRKVKPVNDFIGYESFNLPPGTWSDDSSLTLCTVESLLDGLDYKDIANKFSKWLSEGYWTSFGYPFDIGNSKLLMKFPVLPIGIYAHRLHAASIYSLQ